MPSLDLSEGLLAARPKTGRAAALALYEVRSRIELPPPEAIPDRARIAQATGADAQRWTVPNTEIILVRVQSGPRSGEFLGRGDNLADSASGLLLHPAIGEMVDEAVVIQGH